MQNSAWNIFDPPYTNSILTLLDYNNIVCVYLLPSIAQHHGNLATVTTENKPTNNSANKHTYNMLHC